MKNWKTTLFGLLGGLAMLFGPRLSGDHSAPAINWVSLIQAVAVVGLGLFAKDKNVTGGTTAQTTEAQSRVQVQFTPLH